MSRSDIPNIAAVNFSLSISKERMNRFFDATAWPHAPRPNSHPTIATCFRQGEFELLKTLGINLKNVLHGEQSYKYHKTIQADIEYSGQTELAQFHEKNGASGVMRFYVFKTTLVNTNTKELAMECLSTIIYREATK